jgi:nicotinate-nucleotide adenylyltransferase
MSGERVTPLPVPASGPEAPALVVVFGGTFDPPHRGHAELPARVRDELERRAACAGRGWLVYVPAARSPHKAGGPEAPDADRVEMLRLAIADANLPRAGVWTDEIDRAAAERAAGREPGPSYSVEMLGRAREWLDDRGLGGVPLRLLIGADQALSFHRWRQPRDVLRLARPAVMVRETGRGGGGGGDAEGLLRGLEETGFWDARELEAWREAVVEVGRIDVSATMVREALRRGAAEVERWLTRGVAGYIRGRGLYKG